MALQDSEKYSHETYQQIKAGGPSDFPWKSLRDKPLRGAFEIFVLIIFNLKNYKF
jgi:hypothetical protein